MNSKLSLLNPEYRTRRFIEYQINYEGAAGIHTYHYCEACNKNACRSLMCVPCWKEALQEKFKLLQENKNDPIEEVDATEEADTGRENI